VIDARKQLASYIRTQFNKHTQTVQDIVGSIPDEELISEWHTHCALKTAQADSRQAGRVRIVPELLVTGQMREAAWHRPHYLKAVL
jgi:hypothetical protein